MSFLARKAATSDTVEESCGVAGAYAVAAALYAFFIAATSTSLAP